MRSLSLIIAIAGSYLFLRGWEGAPGLLMRSCLAVATLVAGLALWSSGKRSRLPKMFCTRRATWLDYLSLGAVIVFTEACFVVITSTLAGPAQNLAYAFNDISVETNPFDQKNANGSPEFDGSTSGNWLFTNSLKRNLPPSSNHKPSNKPEVFVELPDKQSAQRILTSRIHLRSFAMSRFNGATWSANRLPTATINPPVSFPRTDHSRVTSAVLQHKIYHAANPTGQNVLVTFQGPISTNIGPLQKISNAIHILPPPKDSVAGYEYSAVSRPVDFTNLIGANPEPAEADATYLNIPNTPLTERIQNTAKQFRYESNLTEKLLAIRIYLQNNYTYSLKTKNPSGINPIENFLYEEKRGYCEHFATATVLLCRSLGVPSRIAYGWSGGKLYPAQNMFVFRAKDAHAWTEIKLKGYGWVVFDTTPPDANDVPTSFSASEDEQAPDPLDAITSDTPETSSDGSDTSLYLPSGFNYSRLISSLVIIGVCCTFFLIIRFVKKPLTDPSGKKITVPTPGYLQQFKRATATHGKPMPQGRTLRQQIELLSHSGENPHFAQELLTYHYNTLYGDQQRDHSHEKSLTRIIRKWADQHRVK